MGTVLQAESKCLLSIEKSEEGQKEISRTTSRERKVIKSTKTLFKKLKLCMNKKMNSKSH